MEVAGSGAADDSERRLTLVYIVAELADTRQAPSSYSSFDSDKFSSRIIEDFFVIMKRT